MRDRHEARGIVLCLDPLKERAQDPVNGLGLHALQVRPDRLPVVLAEVISRMEPSRRRAGKRTILCLRLQHQVFDSHRGYSFAWAPEVFPVSRSVRASMVTDR